MAAKVKDPARLSTAEQERGWAVFACPDHGFLVATMAEAVVTCGHRTRGKRCGRKAQIIGSDKP